MWTLLITALRGSLGPFLVLFIQFLKARRADDHRLLDFALGEMRTMEKLTIPADEKYAIAFKDLLAYGKELGIDLGSAGVDAILALVLPSARAK